MDTKRPLTRIHKATGWDYAWLPDGGCLGGEEGREAERPKDAKRLLEQAHKTGGGGAPKASAFEQAQKKPGNVEGSRSAKLRKIPV